jgi:hypothetical protein
MCRAESCKQNISLTGQKNNFTFFPLKFNFYITGIIRFSCILILEWGKFPETSPCLKLLDAMQDVTPQIFFAYFLYN